MSLARPKSQILTTLFSDRRMFLAARSRWMHCQGRTQGQRGVGWGSLLQLEAGELLWGWGKKLIALGEEEGVGIAPNGMCKTENNSGNKPILGSVF